MNLLPAGYKKQLIRERKFYRLMAYNAIIFLFIILFVTVQMLQIAAIKEEKSRTEEKLLDEKYISSEVFYSEYIKLQEKTDELEASLALIPDVQISAKNIFAYLIDDLPEGCFFEEINISGGAIYFSGYVSRKEGAVQFLESLPPELSPASLEGLEKREDGYYTFRFSWSLPMQAGRVQL